MGELTLEQLQNLPSLSQWERLPKTPDGFPDLRFMPLVGSMFNQSPQGGLVLNLQPTTTSGADWLRQYQNYILLGAGVLLLLALVRGGRR